MRYLRLSIAALMLLILPLTIGFAGCGSSLLPLLPGDNNSRPAGTDFENAPLLTLDSSGNASFTGRIDASGADVYDLGPFAVGDRIIVSVDPSANSSLDPTTAIFNSTGELLALNDDADYANGQIGSYLDETISVADDHYYLAIAKYYRDSYGGAYTAGVHIDRGGVFTQPAVQYLLLDFSGGSVTLPGEGTINLVPFDAADVDPAYTGKTAQIIAKILEIVEQNYRNTGLVVVTSADPPTPANLTSTIFFGNYSADKFGLAQNVDQGNYDYCDDAIVYTNRFDDPFAVQPSADGLGVAIGNVAAHEAGHLLGLNHVADVWDLMDNTGSASTLLADQEFKTSFLSPSIFPFGKQNGPLMLDRVVPR